MNWLIRSLVASMLGGCLYTSASAVPTVVSFIGSGTVGIVGPCGPTCLTLEAIGSSNDFPDTIAGDWSFSSVFDEDFALEQVSGDWYLDDLGASDNDLWGTIAGASFPVGDGSIQQALLDYTVLGGGGMFAGMVGSGASTVLINLATGGAPVYSEVGYLVLNAVPEPSLWLLALVGGLVVFWLGRRATSRGTRPTLLH